MSLSDELYTDALHFQNERKKVMDAYEATIKGLEDKKGSRYYTEQKQKATTERDAALAELKSKYGSYIDGDIKKMREANSKRGMKAPTADELNILQALKMKDTVTAAELELAANSVSNNALCLSVLQEIANKNGIIKPILSKYEGTETPAEVTSKYIDSIETWIPDFLNYDTNYAARAAEHYHAIHYGGEPRELPKRELFDSKDSFYSKYINANGDALKSFYAAVDGTGEAAKE